MKGVFNLRPPCPKYTTSWDVNKVLTFLKTLYPNEGLTLREFTLKSVCLVALISGQRAQSIHEMDLQYTSTSDGSSFTFLMKNLTKQVRPGIQQTPIRVSKYTLDPCLCAHSALKTYIQKTAGLRKSSKLWISYVKPHQEVGRQTISRWLKSTLELSGIDTSTFSAHSTRMASTSKAAAMGVGLQTILKTAGGSKAQNFKKFYHREIDLPKNAFAEGVLTPDTD